jgi:hypothetical protein
MVKLPVKAYTMPPPTMAGTAQNTRIPNLLLIVIAITLLTPLFDSSQFQNLDPRPCDHGGKPNDL